jgi:hypothetical protein
MDECRKTLVSPGLIFSGKLRFEAYGIDTAGRETVETRTVPFEELASLTGIPFWEAAPGELQFHHDTEVTLVNSHMHGRPWVGYKNGTQRVEVLLKFFINIYQERNLTLPPAGSRVQGVSRVPILACLIGERREFILEGEATLTLQVKPRQIIKLMIRALEATPVINEGLIGFDGRMEVAVGFVDERYRYYETTFTPLFQKAFNWDKLQPQDTVMVRCRLNHYTYTWEGAKVFCRYWLTLAAENRRETEIAVEIAPLQSGLKKANWEYESLANEKSKSRWGSGENLVAFKTPDLKSETGRLGTAPFTSQFIPTCAPWRFIMGGEIPLKIGNAREVETSDLRLSRTSCRPAKDGLILEGVLSGRIEYWDQDLFLQGEKVEISFWRLARKDPGGMWNYRDFQLELGKVTVTPVLPSSRGNDKVKVRFEIQLRVKS